METILHLLPLAGTREAAFQAAIPESKHLFLPTSDHGGVGSIPQGWQRRTTILLGYAPPDQLKTFPNLKWIQSWNAGVDPHLAPDVLPGSVRLTSTVGAYGPAMSGRMLVMLLAIRKRLPAYRDQQRVHIWVDLGPVGSLAGKTVLMGGTGDIGRHFARLVHALGAQQVIRLRQSTSYSVEGFGEIYGLGALDGLLPQADVMALALPHTPGIVDLVSKARLLVMRPGAVLLDTGHGSIVNCTTLMEVLCSGRLLGTGLDVTDPEPLSPGHPLWEASSLLLTPHTAGGYNHMEVTLERIKAIFSNNLRRYVEDRTLRNRVR